MQRRDREIVVRGAREHNLQGIDLSIPRNRLTVITGVSGSGKSSLAFDTLFREGQRRFLESLPSFTRQFVTGLERPQVASLEGLGPAVAVGQRVGLSNPRSTVGTLTEVWDLLRLLFARLGSAPGPLRPTRGLFSFNGAEGACPRCQGLGVEDRLDLDRLVADPAHTLREGALRVSTPNGYLMYSQVTLAVLDQVLRAHGGSVDVPWRDLTEEVRQVVLHGSERLRVPYGKHPLESRLRWTGITARPRQEGFYRGLVPVMEEILRGKRNDSILRFVRTSSCRACGGARLRPEALSVTWQGRRITDLAALTASALPRQLRGFSLTDREEAVFEPIRQDLLARCRLMAELGLAYLSFDRAAPTLSRGEVQRLRLLSLALGELSGLLVVLDEPSAGLHPHDAQRLLGVLRRLRDQGQTVVVVEHDATLAQAADWLVDLGPGPGRSGGQVLWSGPPSARPAASQAPIAPRSARGDRAVVRLESLRRHNLQDVAVELKKQALNVVTGVSGAGKTSLLQEVVARLSSRAPADGPFQRLIVVDADPIGRTPRSNPATYTGASDLIRDCFAATPEARSLGLGKSHFSFNTQGGRCETCEGAGVLEVGMRYLGSVELACDTCHGQRFQKHVLSVKYRGLTIAEVLQRSVAEAAEHFAGHPRLSRILRALIDLGLGYLPLGQPATTLSGGEAQRVKLAAELARPGSAPALIALDEPSTGLHPADVAVMLSAWDRMIGAGHTLLVVDNDPDVVRRADQVVDLGPGSGPEGGTVVVMGSPEAVTACSASLTGAALRAQPAAPASPPASEPPLDLPMTLQGVSTHNLRGLDVAFPGRGLTVVTGPSGCGKSSLVFDTLLAEAQNRFADLVAPWARRLLPRRGGAELASAQNLQAAVSVPQQAGRRNPRSTVGTVTEIDELLRLLFARAGERPCPACGARTATEACACGARLPALWAAAFSPNTESGSCSHCKGLGFVQRCDPERLVTYPDRPLAGGAMDGTKYGAYLGEPDGQHLATLQAAAAALGLSVGAPWNQLDAAARELAMRGAGERQLEVSWQYRRGQRSGVHRFTGPWPGFAALVEREHERTHTDARGQALEVLLVDAACPACQGERLGAGSRQVTVGGRRLPEVLRTPVERLRGWFEELARDPQGQGVDSRRLLLTAGLRSDLLRRLEALADAGLGYLEPGREIASLSGGEAQRVRLAAALGGGLVGITYVLDEPSQGLHPRDTERLVRVLRGLADAGNAVVVVEHDPALIAAADQVIELGPGAGPEGGRVVATGAPATLLHHPESRIGRLLRRPARRSPRGGLSPGASIRGACLHNLRQCDVSFPVGALVAVSGVSGSGKSTLVFDVLAPSLEAHRQGRAPVGCRELQVLVKIEELVTAHQDLPARSGLSTVASLIGVSERLRKRFAATPQARAAKLTVKHFSTASAGGRCEACQGRGVTTVAMDLLPDVTVGCEVCQGRRFREEVLACHLDGHGIAEVLDAPLQDAAAWFEADAALAQPLRALIDLGLGYLRLGQEGQSLSMGERQRLRLAGLLAGPRAPGSAVLLDEPTKGLGFEDVDRLIAALHRLAGDGHLVVVVEHDLDLLAAADWVIDLGPEGGDGGGRVVVAGPPAVVAAADSHTGRALSARLRAAG